MSTHNIQCHDEIRTFPQILVPWSYWKNSVGTQNKFESAMVNEPSGFELLRFDCKLFINVILKR